MSRNIIIDLNKYEKVAELPEFDGLKLILQTPDGQEPIPPLFFIKKNKQNLIKDPEGVVWNPNIKIDMYGNPEQYAKLVDWWFDNMLEDEETKTIFNDMSRNATEKGFNLKAKVEDLRAWLKKCQKSKRKSTIKMFLMRNISNEVTKLLKYHK